MLPEMITTPEVPAHAARRGDGAWTLTVVCCFCARPHVHGGGRDDAPAYGHRLAHCVGRDRAGDYILIAGPADMARPDPRPRAGRGKPQDISKETDRAA